MPDSVVGDRSREACVDDTQRQLIERLGVLLRTGWAAAALAEARSRAAGAGALRPFRHPNGFWRVPLGEPEADHQLQLHHWPLGCSDELSIHTHRRPFASYIAQGELRASEYDVSEKSDHDRGGCEYVLLGCHHRRTGVMARYVLEAAGTICLRRAATERQKAGDLYSLGDGRFHSVTVNPNLVTSTVVLEGMITQPSTYIAMGAIPDDLDRVGLPVATDEVLAAVSTVAAVLECSFRS